MSDLMHVATITSAFGIKGQVKVHLFLENTEIFEVGAEFFYKNKKLTLTAITFVKSDFAHMSFKEITDRTQAESLRNTQLFLPSDLLPSLSDDEFYLRDLKTYKVKGSNTPDIIGEVLDLYNYGAGDILEILYDGHEIMVPFKSDFVIDINEEKKEMIIDSDYIISMTTPVEPMKVI